jgi:hypothetical protein
MLPVIVGLIAGGLVLLASADKKESKSYDDGLKDGRKAADDEHKAKTSTRPSRTSSSDSLPSRESRFGLSARVAGLAQCVTSRTTRR